MNSYQFEDLISEYLDNNLPHSTRKEFEQYLVEHPQAQGLVNSVRSTIDILKSTRKISTSGMFMPKLMDRIEKEKGSMNQPIALEKRNIFGFTPAYAGLFTVALLSLLYFGSELLPNRPENSIMLPQLSQEGILPTVTAVSNPVKEAIVEDAVIAIIEDSTKSDQVEPNKKTEVGDKIKFVKSHSNR